MAALDSWLGSRRRGSQKDAAKFGSHSDTLEDVLAKWRPATPSPSSFHGTLYLSGRAIPSVVVTVACDIDNRITPSAGGKHIDVVSAGLLCLGYCANRRGFFRRTLPKLKVPENYGLTMY